MRRMMLIAFTFVVISLLGASSAGAVVIDMGGSGRYGVALIPGTRSTLTTAGITTVDRERAVHRPLARLGLHPPEQRPLLHTAARSCTPTRRSRSRGIRIGSTGRRRGTMSSSSSRTSPTAARAPNSSSVAVLAVLAHQSVSRRRRPCQLQLSMVAAASTSVSPADPRASLRAPSSTGPRSQRHRQRLPGQRHQPTSGRTRAAPGGRTPTRTASPTTRSAPRSRRWSARWGCSDARQNGYTPLIVLRTPTGVVDCLDSAGKICSANGVSTAQFCSYHARRASAAPWCRTSFSRGPRKHPAMTPASPRGGTTCHGSSLRSRSPSDWSVRSARDNSLRSPTRRSTRGMRSTAPR